MKNNTSKNGTNNDMQYYGFPALDLDTCDNLPFSEENQAILSKMAIWCNGNESKYMEHSGLWFVSYGDLCKQFPDYDFCDDRMNSYINVYAKSEPDTMIGILDNCYYSDAIENNWVCNHDTMIFTIPM